MLFVTGLSNTSLDMSKGKGGKNKNTLDLSRKAEKQCKNKNKWDLLKLKSFCTAGETINKIKSQHTEWEKIFGNNVSDKALIYKICREITTQAS